ncbi:MAG: Nif3-like dinuclear metal center hexameric protein [Bacteroidales bacterium]|nr:Nif3-like dinuclear metal center hexameric protein [Bacteroidales bacterium]
MVVKEVISAIENYAPLSFQESYDNAGLILGSPEMEVSAALICIDITEEVVEEAINKGINLIISHHPLIFSGLKRIIGNSYIEKAVIKALKHDIAVYCAHTNMDITWDGVNIHVAKKIGLKEIEILRPLQKHLVKIVTFVPNSHATAVREALFEAGAGHIGNYDSCSYNIHGEGTFRGLSGSNPFVGEPHKLHFESEVRIETICPRHILSQVIKAMLKAHPYEEPAYDIYPIDNLYERAGLGVVGNLERAVETYEFLLFIKELFKVPLIKHTKPIKKFIERVAFCGGSGSDLLTDALKAKADIFISADFKYHQFFNTEGQVIIADIGHFESEQYTKEIFYQILTKKFPNFAVHFSEINTNPVNYL